MHNELKLMTQISDALSKLCFAFHGAVDLKNLVIAFLFQPQVI
jgi:hypothetical protein